MMPCQGLGVTLNRRAEKGQHLIQFLYRKPVVNINEVAELLELTPKSASALVTEFVNLDILHEITGQRRNRIFKFNEYVRLFEQD